jgi:hypothetical protein
MLVYSLHAQRSRNCQQARVARATGGAVCPVRDQVQEHNHDLKRRGEVLGRQPCLLPIAAPVILEAIGPDEQEPVNELEALLLRLRMIVADIGSPHCMYKRAGVHIS